MVFNATFNNIFLLVEETGIPGERHRSVVNQWETLSHNVFYRVHLAWVRFELTTLVVIGTDCIGRCKSNYHTITTTTAFKAWTSYIWRDDNDDDVRIKCTWPTCRVWYFAYGGCSLKQQSTGKHVDPPKTHNPHSEPTSLCSHSLMLCAYYRSSKYQFNSLWFHPIDARTHNPLHSN